MTAGTGEVDDLAGADDIMATTAPPPTATAGGDMGVGVAIAHTEVIGKIAMVRAFLCGRSPLT